MYINVGNMSFDTNEEELRKVFSEYGTVRSVKVMTNSEGRSRGFGFVEMATPEEAQAAIEMWNEKELDGRAIIVNIARPREERSF